MESKKPVELISLQDLVTGRRFVIPEYQRGYSWETPQLKDLRKDIENLYGSSHMHYTGTIVASSNNPDHEDAFEIVDGQQRLTTLIILLKQILDSDPAAYESLFSTYIQRGTTGNEKLVLEPNEETSQYFKDVIINGRSVNPDIKSHRCLRDAKKYFSKWISRAEDERNEILNIVTSRLGFIFYSPRYEKEIGIMFEVINNRGKALSQLEKIKNYLIYWATIKGKDSLHGEINNRWGSIQKNLSAADRTSNQDEDRFLRNCYIVFYETNKEKSWRVYEQLKERYNPKESNPAKIDKQTKKIQRFLSFLEESSKTYVWLYKPKAFLNEMGKNANTIKVDRILTQLRFQPAIASVMPIFLAVMSRWGDRPERVADLLETLEKMNFRVYNLPKITSRADSKQGDTFLFANEFYKYPEWTSENWEDVSTEYSGKKVNGDIFDWLEMELLDFTTHFCPEKKFVQALTLDDDEADDYYKWNAIRYFLANYEAYLQKKAGVTYHFDRIGLGRGEEGVEANDHLSIEHIWAKKNRHSDFDEHYIEKRRLGNFVLLGMSSNISLSAGDIPDKVDELRDYNSKNTGAMLMLHIRELVDEICPEAERYLSKDIGWVKQTKNYFENLSTSINDQRENRMIRFALERWRVKGERMHKFEKVDSFQAQNERRSESYYLKEEQK